MEYDTESEWNTVTDNTAAAENILVSLFKDVKNLVIEGGTFNTVQHDIWMPVGGRFGKEDVRNIRGKVDIIS